MLVLANAVSLSGNVDHDRGDPVAGADHHWQRRAHRARGLRRGLGRHHRWSGGRPGGGRDRPGAHELGGRPLSGLAVTPLPVLLALDALEIWHVVLLAVLGTLADSAGSTARQSLVPAAADAGRYQRERANALFTSAEHVGYLLGAPVAGLLIAAFGSPGRCG